MSFSFSENILVYALACVHRDMKHTGSLESTQKARVARGVVEIKFLRIFHALQTSCVLHISMNAR